jgi:hypothetical protein
MDVISGNTKVRPYPDRDPEDIDLKPLEPIPENLPKGVEVIQGKHGNTYHYQGKIYDNVEDIRGFLGKPLRSSGIPENVSQTLSQVSGLPGVSHLLKAASTIGDLTELPGEKRFAEGLGTSVQQWGIPYWVGETAGYFVYPGFGEAKALTKTMEAASVARQGLRPAFVGVTANDGLLSTAVREGVDLNPTVFKYTKQQRTPEIQQLITDSRGFKPKGFNTNKWDNYIGKFGSKEGALAAIEKAKESAAYLKKHGSLKGNNNIWTDPNTGISYLVKNKAKRGEISIGFDSLKSIETTLAKRLKGAKLDTKEIERIGKGLGWDDVKIQKYIETNEQAKRTLEALIRDLNKGEGRTMWSLGHRSAVKTLPHSADRALNIELEPLVDVLTKEGRTILGNTGRAANDELIELFKKITNNPLDLEADMIHWGDSLVGNFMPRMREITNADDFFKEIVKREDFLNKIKAYAKKEKVSLEEAADVLMKPLMDKTPVSQPPYFE